VKSIAALLAERGGVNCNRERGEKPRLNVLTIKDSLQLAAGFFKFRP
jgi:hypothetical protein